MKNALEIINEFDLIGVPFDWKGRDYTKSLDCYGLVKFIHEQQGKKMPDYITPDPEESKQFVADSANESKHWARVGKDDANTQGHVLVFRTCNYLHVAYALGDGRFAHTWEKSGGVCIENLNDWKSRIEGVYEFIGS